MSREEVVRRLVAALDAAATARSAYERELVRAWAENDVGAMATAADAMGSAWRTLAADLRAIAAEFPEFLP